MPIDPAVAPRHHSVATLATLEQRGKYVLFGARHTPNPIDESSASVRPNQTHYLLPPRPSLPRAKACGYKQTKHIASSPNCDRGHPSTMSKRWANYDGDRPPPPSAGDGPLPLCCHQ